MDFSTVLGIVAGVGLIGWALASGGDAGIFLNWSSLAITLGGTFAATLIHYRLGQLMNLFRAIRKVFTTPKTDPVKLIERMVGFAETARREGLLALEEASEELDDDFVRKGLQLVIDGTDADLIRHMLETELEFQQERHRTGQEIMQTMAALAPAFGMVGTLIGLIQMLRNLDNPDAIGPGLAVALITTFYGVLASNLLFQPLAGKLRISSQEEIFLREMVIEGVLSIQAGDNPRIVGEKLRAFLASQDRDRMETRDRRAARLGEMDVREEAIM